MYTMRIPPGHEQVHQVGGPASHHLLALLTHWCQAQWQSQRTTPPPPDDAREQLRRDRLNAERGLQLLGMRVRLPM